MGGGVLDIVSRSGIWDLGGEVILPYEGGGPT